MACSRFFTSPRLDPSSVEISSLHTKCNQRRCIHHRHATKSLYIAELASSVRVVMEYSESWKSKYFSTDGSFKSLFTPLASLRRRSQNSRALAESLSKWARTAVKFTYLPPSFSWVSRCIFIRKQHSSSWPLPLAATHFCSMLILVSPPALGAKCTGRGYMHIHS